MAQASLSRRPGAAEGRAEGRVEYGSPGVRTRPVAAMNVAAWVGTGVKGKFTVPPCPMVVVEVRGRLRDGRRGVGRRGACSRSAPAPRYDWSAAHRSARPSSPAGSAGPDDRPTGRWPPDVGGRSESRDTGHLQLQKVSEGSTALCAPGNEVIWLRKAWRDVRGHGHLDETGGSIATSWGSEAKWTVIGAGWAACPTIWGLHQPDGLRRHRGDLERAPGQVDGRVDRGAGRVPAHLLHDVGRQQIGEEHLPVGEEGAEPHRHGAALVAALDRRDVAVAGHAGHRIGRVASGRPVAVARRR